MGNKNTMKWLMLVSFALVLIGGLNWLLIGFFEFDLVATIFLGAESVMSRLIYSIIGIAAVVLGASVISSAMQKKKKSA